MTDAHSLHLPPTDVEVTTDGVGGATSSSGPPAEAATGGGAPTVGVDRRSAHRERTTKETSIAISLDLDGPTGTVHATTGLPFFDHMLDQIGRHGGFDLTIEATGDLHVDAHHTVEDVGILLGEVFREALGAKAGIRRFASGQYPLDEALIEVALDLSGRPFVAYDVAIGDVLPLGDPPFNPEMVEHFWQSFATAAGITLHVTKKAGRNTHHVVEATFKAVSRCLRDAVRVEGTSVPSTKGSL
jgi:imidazoleglycerol-phosphate dehydratase